MCKDCSKITYIEFTRLLNVPLNSTTTHQLFQIYDKVNIQDFGHIRDILSD